MASHVRTVYHTIHDPTGQPWPGFTLHFLLTPTAVVPHATLPEQTANIVTDSDGYFEVELETGVRYELTMYSALVKQGAVTNYGNRNVITLVVPHGEGPISLPTVLALNTEPDGDPDLITLANDHMGRIDNPHAVTAAQTGAYSTGEADGLLGAHTGDTSNPHAVTADQVGLGNVANLAPADLPVSDAAGLAIGAVTNDLADHLADDANPHGVTKAQVGLGDVPNVDATQRDNHTGEQAISTVTGLQSALDDKADSSSLALVATSGDYGDLDGLPTLGTAAATDASDYATAAQGQTADAALPAASLDGLITAHSDVAANTAARHSHGNKALLDGITDAALVPAPGQRGQVLTIGGSGRTWADVPGIVYPSLLLSPDGSFDRNGAVTPTVTAGVTTAPGQYGQAWQKTSGSGGYVDYSAPGVIQTILLRARVHATNGSNFFVRLGDWVGSPPPTQSFVLQVASPTSVLWATRYNAEGALGGTLAVGSDWFWSALQLAPGVSHVLGDGIGQGAHFRTPTMQANFPASIRLFDNNSGHGYLESVLIYPVALPDSEIARIAAMPAAWTMDNAAANTLIPSDFDPNAQTASGSTVVRTAPGAATQAVKTLSAGTLIEATGEVVTVSSVDYTLIIVGRIQGWIPTLQITTL